MFLTLAVVLGACAGLICLNVLLGFAWYTHRRKQLAKRRKRRTESHSPIKRQSTPQYRPSIQGSFATSGPLDSYSQSAIVSRETLLDRHPGSAYYHVAQAFAPLPPKEEVPHDPKRLPYNTSVPSIVIPRQLTAGLSFSDAESVYSVASAPRDNAGPPQWSTRPMVVPRLRQSQIKDEQPGIDTSNIYLTLPRDASLTKLTRSNPHRGRPGSSVRAARVPLAAA